MKYIYLTTFFSFKKALFSKNSRNLYAFLFLSHINKKKRKNLSSFIYIKKFLLLIKN